MFSNQHCLFHPVGGLDASEVSKTNHGAWTPRLGAEEQKVVIPSIKKEEAGGLSPVPLVKRHIGNSGLAGGLDVLVDAAQVALHVLVYTSLVIFIIYYFWIFILLEGRNFHIFISHPQKFLITGI